MTKTLLVDETLSLTGDVGLLIGGTLSNGTTFVVGGAPSPSVDLLPELLDEVELMLPGGLKVIGSYNGGTVTGIQDCIAVEAKDGKVQSARRNKSALPHVSTKIELNRVDMFFPAGTTNAATVVIGDNFFTRSEAEATVSNCARGAVLSAQPTSSGFTAPLFLALLDTTNVKGVDVMCAVDQVVARALKAAKNAETDVVDRVGVQLPRFELSVWCSTPNAGDVKALVSDLFGVKVKSSALSHPTFEVKQKKVSEVAASPTTAAPSPQGQSSGVSIPLVIAVAVGLALMVVVFS